VYEDTRVRPPQGPTLELSTFCTPYGPAVALFAGEYLQLAPRTERLDHRVERIWLARMFPAIRLEHRRLGGERDGGFPFDGENTVLRLPPQPIAESHFVFDPGEDRLFLKAPCVEALEGVAHKRVRGPEPQDRVRVRGIAHGHLAYRIRRHVRVGKPPPVRLILGPRAVLPRRVDHDHAEGAGGHRLGLSLDTLGHLVLFDRPGGVTHGHFSRPHCGDQRLVCALQDTLGGHHRVPAHSHRPADVVAGTALSSFGRFRPKLGSAPPGACSLSLPGLPVVLGLEFRRDHAPLRGVQVPSSQVRGHHVVDRTSAASPFLCVQCQFRRRTSCALEVQQLLRQHFAKGAMG